MGKFELDNEKIRQIEEKFGVERETVIAVQKVYADIDKEMKRQYLAHIIRAVEEKIRVDLKNPAFRIICKERDAEWELPDFGCAHYFPDKNKYVIYYHPARPTKQIRIVIAHELGHLIYRLKGIPKGIQDPEPLASIFGLIAILEKNRFYAEATKDFQYPTWEEMISDFSLLLNQSKGIYNKS